MSSSLAGRANPLPTLPSSLVDALGEVLPRVTVLARPRTLVPVWATVELDAAAASIRTADRSTPVLEASVLGARMRLIGFAGPDADPQEVLVAEPSTEGALAAFLARHGEGWAAVYVVAEAGAEDRLREADLSLSSAAIGPLGTERRILATDRSGPFIVLATPG